MILDRPSQLSDGPDERRSHATRLLPRVGGSSPEPAAAGRHPGRRSVPGPVPPSPLTLLLMTLLVPGSAQLAVGRRGVGRVALRVWMAVVLGLVTVVLLGLMWHGLIYWMVSSTAVLGFIRLLLCGLAVGWALLFFDAWRLGQPLELLQRQRLAMVGLNGVVTFAVAGSLLFASHMVAVQRGFIRTMFGDGTATAAHQGRYNVLLLGGDSGADRWGLRPDSITVASIDADTGRTILFGLPRNMVGFPSPRGR